jgi:hypothetical protein
MNTSDMMLVGSVLTFILSLFGVWFAVVKFIAPFFKRLKKWMSTWEHFMEDWFGEEERPGVPARDGVMQRLHSIEGELKPNGGGSIKDSINRIETKVGEIEDRLQDGNKRFDEIERTLTI